MNKNTILRITLPILLLLGAVGVYWLVTAQRAQAQAGFTVSGTIEAVSSTISTEIGGKVAEIMVSEGAEVKRGEILFLMDETLLKAQAEQANAGLITAQKASETALAAANTAQLNYEMTAAAARQESATIRAADWSTQNPEGFTLPGGSFTAAEQIEAAKNALNYALEDRDEAKKDLERLLADEDNADFIQAETVLLETRFEAQSLREVLTKASSSRHDELREEAQDDYDEALNRLEQAQKDYDDLKERGDSEKLLAARVTLVAAEERVQAAQTGLAALQTGENSLKVLAANAAYEQALAAADQADQTVRQAEANLNLINTQLAKLAVTSPIDGVVLMRSVELGEVLATGATAMTVGQLDPLTITIYVPEVEHGLLTLGQQAILKVDSFPEETFDATIIHIADQAEFTPRNVQTVEGRKTTVFAVKLEIANPKGSLKPGMPADVTFN